MEPANAKRQLAAAEIEVWLIAHISRYTGMARDDIDIREPFVYHGFKSKQV